LFVVCLIALRIGPCASQASQRLVASVIAYCALYFPAVANHSLSHFAALTLLYKLHYAAANRLRALYIHVGAQQATTVCRGLQHRLHVQWALTAMQ
jgi:hypothetical protein